MVSFLFFLLLVVSVLAVTAALTIRFRRPVRIAALPVLARDIIYVAGILGGLVLFGMALRFGGGWLLGGLFLIATLLLIGHLFGRWFVWLATGVALAFVVIAAACWLSNNWPPFSINPCGLFASQPCPPAPLVAPVVQPTPAPAPKASEKTRATMPAQASVIVTQTVAPVFNIGTALPASLPAQQETVQATEEPLMVLPPCEEARRLRINPRAMPGCSPAVALSAVVASKACSSRCGQ